MASNTNLVKKRRRMTSLNINSDINVYNEFIKKYHCYKKQVDHKKFKTIISRFNELLSKNIVSNRDGVLLPQRLGHIYIVGFKSKNKNNINYKVLNETGKRVMHSNFVTDGYISKIVYTNYNRKFSLLDRGLWAFNACKNLKQNVSKAFRENYSFYIKSASIYNIQIRDKRNRGKEYMEKKSSDFDESYNNF